MSWPSDATRRQLLITTDGGHTWYPVRPQEGLLMRSSNNRGCTRRAGGRTAAPGLLHQQQRRCSGLVAIAVAAAVVFGGCDNDGRTSRDSGDGTAPTHTDVTAPAPAVVAKFKLSTGPETPVFTPGTAWIPTQHRGQLVRVDAATNAFEVVRQGHGMGLSSAMAAFGSLWLSHEGKGLFRLDPDTGDVIARIPENVGLNTSGAVGFGSLWGMAPGRTVVRIDPNTNQVVARLRVSNKEAETHVMGCVEPFRRTCPDYLTVHKDRVVVFVDGEDVAVHIDPTTNQVTKRVVMPANPSGFYRLHGDVPWIMTEDGLAQVDLDSGEVLAQIPLREDQRLLLYPALHHAIAINGDTAWLVADYTTTQINLTGAEIVKTFETPGSGGVLGASFGHGDLWISYAGGTVRRLDLSGS
jgi:streptogramin lyase